MAVLAYAKATGPNDGLTGAPGEPTCSVCHAPPTGETPDGKLIVDAPDEFSPGDNLTIAVNLADSGQIIWGFELTALDTLNQSAGKFFLTDSAHTQLSVAGGTGRVYVKQTLEGAYGGTPDNSPGWQFQWRAPSVEIGPVTFYAAGVAGNNMGSTTNDFVYVTSHQMIEAAAPACCLGGTGDVNFDGAVSADIADLTFLVNYLFVDFRPLPCPAEANIDADPNGLIDISDLTTLVDHLFVSFAPLPNCP
jgi:hypothetical protein